MAPAFDPPEETVAEIDLGNDRFPAIFREGIEIDEVVLLNDPREPVLGGTTEDVGVTLPDGSRQEISLSPSSMIDGVLEGSASGFAVKPGSWELAIIDVPAALADDDRLDPEKIEEVVNYPAYSPSSAAPRGRKLTACN